VRGDEIVVAKWQKPVLLASSSKAYAEYLPRSHRYQRLAQLIVDLERCRARIEERRHPQQHVVEPLDLDVKKRNEHHAERNEVPDSDTARKENYPHYEREHHRGRDVRLQHDEDVH